MVGVGGSECRAVVTADGVVQVAGAGPLGSWVGPGAGVQLRSFEVAGGRGSR